MTYKIEDIIWDEMPEGAVEFSLEDEEYIFCWYNKNGEWTDWCGTTWRDISDVDSEDMKLKRERYKVSDYHPDSISTMSDADKIKYFLKELSELSNKYKVVIHGCGCMGSPSLHTEDFVEGGHYTVDEYNDFLEYSQESTQD